MSAAPIKVLLIEDNPGDVKFIEAMFSECREFSIDSADSLARGMNTLKGENFNAVLLDLNLPDSNGINTLLAFHANCPEYPVVVLTGFDEAEWGLLSVQTGAQDYLNKRHLDSCLVARSLHYAIERHKLLASLKQSLREIRCLRGLLPICMNCKKIRDDDGYWSQIEKYISEHSSLKFTHGLCPDCLIKYGQTKKTNEFAADSSQTGK